MQEEFSINIRARRFFHKLYVCEGLFCSWGEREKGGWKKGKGEEVPLP
jgi:hypothetical protein